ncbi:MFS transporter [Candidatus Methylacidithermus pantelleriae]|uniref:Inner membrane component of tripartite multidrug resistance system n=1 Tax=Candidatus Methylacidithermus pantelleriae TaxID=2744239 RepID=A0A8J2BRL2_9BACT|nr:MFS transporter [Candidatus Methylacidithermus pantelleriae]CAF0701932.1 Inner membrane component of tripartite multidrug resistance system [Candidatus Methylacidithermus pantelleriae]
MKEKKDTPSGMRLGVIQVLIGVASLFALCNGPSFTDLMAYTVAELGESPSHGPWMNGTFFSGLGIGVIASSHLSHRFGRRPIFVSAALGLALSSFFCALTINYYLFLGGRAFQGVFSGLLAMTGQGLLIECYPAELREIPILLWSMVVIGPFSIGPAIGGGGKEFWGHEWLSWRSWFWINGIVAAGAGLGAHLLLPQWAGRATRERRLDVVGLLLLSVWSFCYAIALCMGDDYEWLISPHIRLLVFFGTFSLGLLFFWELGNRHRVVDVTLFLRRNFLIGTFGLAWGFCLFYGLWGTVLVRTQSTWGFDPLLAGFIYVPMVFISQPLVYAGVRFFHRFDARILASCNLLVFALYCLLVSSYDFFRKRSFWLDYVGLQIVQGIWLGTFLLPLTRIAVAGLSPAKEAAAVELSGALRVTLQGWSSPIIGTILYHRSAFHKWRLVEWLPPNHPFLSELFSQWASAGISKEKLLKLLDRQALDRATVLALDDAFRICAWIFLAMALLVWLSRPNPLKTNGYKKR